jgi:hypothetical protein
MSFESTVSHNILLVESASESSFDNVQFKGPLLTSTISASDAFSCIKINGTALLSSTNVIFNKCATSGTGFGLHINFKCSGITLSDSKISTHYKGVMLGDAPESGGPNGVRITQNVFTDIHSEGIDIGAVSMNVSAFNTFMDVGNHFSGVGSPVTSVIRINNDNNLSIGDMFERNDVDNVVSPRIQLNENASIAFDMGKIELGTYVREVGKTLVLTDNTALATTLFVVDLTDSHTSVNIGSFVMNYSINRNGALRTGVITISSDGNVPASLSYNDNYTSNSSTGVILMVSQNANNVSIKYTSSNTGNSGVISYSISRLY